MQTSISHWASLDFELSEVNYRIVIIKLLQNKNEYHTMNIIEMSKRDAQNSN